MVIHELKCWPEFFAEVQKWTKMFEIRHNDRDFMVGDVLLLREWIPTSESYTGASVERRISYITDFPSGLRDGYVCMGLQCVTLGQGLARTEPLPENVLTEGDVVL